MEVVAVLILLCGVYEITCQGGGIKMKIGQHGLNEVVTYLLNNELIPYLEDDLDFGEHTFPFGPAELHINKLRLDTLKGQYGSITISSGNRIGITAGFSVLALAGNLTYVAGADIITAPKTVAYFHDCRLDVYFLLGSEQNKDGVTLDECKAHISKFEATGNLSQALEGVFEAAETSISSLVEQVCPYLENITNDRLNDILNVQDTVTIKSSELGDVLVNMNLLSLSSENDFITVAVEVTSGTDLFTDDVTFPPLDFKGTQYEVVLLINDKLLSDVCELAIQNTVFKELEFEKTVNEVAYKVQANKETVQGTVWSSSDGTSVIWNATFDVHTDSGSCMPYQVSMKSVIPFVFGYSDTVVMASVDRDRLQMEYEVSSRDRSCKDSTESKEANTDVETELLHETNNELEALLRGKTFSLELPKDKWYGFKEAHIKPMNGGLAFSFGMRVGKQKHVKTEDLKNITNEFYDKKVISYRFSDGQTFKIDIPVSTTQAPVSSTSGPFLSVYLIIFSIVLICFQGK